MSFVPPDIAPALPEVFMLGAVCVVLLVDVMLPGMDGFDLVSEIRRSKPALPLIMVTAAGAESEPPERKLELEPIVAASAGSDRERAEAVHQIRGTRAAYLAFIRSQVLQLATAEGRQIAATIYETIDVPVLQLHGAADQSQDIESARALSSRIADTRFVAIEGSDHHVHIDAPERWLEEVTAFAANLQP